MGIKRQDANRMEVEASVDEDKVEAYIEKKRVELPWGGMVYPHHIYKIGKTGDWYQFSESIYWETPQWLFDLLDKEFQFQLDVCANMENAKCERYFTEEIDGLAQDWEGVCWMNPPYGREIGRWIKKAHLSSLKPNTRVVCLLPARTDTRWFHDYCVRGTIWFIKGRLKFGGRKQSAPFPSMVVIFPPKG